jgi:tRNA dimethylallyltransferase
MMIAQGLEKEVRSNLEYRNQYALKTVGYSEFFDYIDGKQDMQSTVNLIKPHTRNFATRQLTWFRRNADTIWVDALNEKAIFDTLKSTFE